MDKELEAALRQVCDALENLVIEYSDSIDTDDQVAVISALAPAQRALDGARLVLQGVIK